MKFEKYYIVEQELNRSGVVPPPKELLFGKWDNKYGILRFEGMTINHTSIDCTIRDTLNHNLRSDSLEGAQALEINLRTYEVVASWMQKFVEEVLRWIEIIPSINDQEDALAIVSESDICITPYGKEIKTGENIIHSMNEETIWGVDIGYGYRYTPFPSVRFLCSAGNFDFFWDEMKKGKTKYISRDSCKLLSCAIRNRFDSIIHQIKYIYQYKTFY